MCLLLSYSFQGLTDNAIKNLAFCCRLLRTLNLAGCDKVGKCVTAWLNGMRYLAVRRVRFLLIYVTNHFI